MAMFLKDAVKWPVLVTLILTIVLHGALGQKAQCSDVTLGTEASNTRIVNTFKTGETTTRCYRFAVPVTGDIRIRVEPCYGPIPTVYVGNSAIGSSLSQTTFTRSGNTLANGIIEVTITDAGGSLFALVENPDGTKGARFAITAIYPVGREPAVGDPNIRFSKRRDTSVILSWIPVADALHTEAELEYGIYEWDLTSTNPFSLFNPPKPEVDSDSQGYFLENGCSVESFAKTLRPFSTMGNASDAEPQFSYQVTDLQPGFRYRFVIVARNPEGIYAVYPPLDMYTWPLGTNGLWAVLTLLILSIICLIEYRYWYSHCKTLRDHMLVGSHELTAEDEFFVPSEYDGYYYVVPEHLIKVLRADEKVVWAGRPEFYSVTKLWFWTWLALNGSLFLIILIAGWLVRDVFHSFIFVPYFVIAFCATLWFFVSMVSPATKVYALTTQRAITYRRLFWFLPAATSLAYHQMSSKDIRTKLLPDESGHVWFDTRRTLWPCCGKRRYGFYYVREAVRAIQHIKHFREEFYNRHLAGDSDEESNLF